MIERSGRRSVPQIFIDGSHLGGFDDLAALQAAGELDQLIDSTRLYGAA
jgi:glutaredoxin 3